MFRSINAIFKDDSLLNREVTLHGWVRSRRDSKAGISFVTLNDGSCFDSIQIVISRDIENYESEILKLTKDCAISITGTLVPSQGKGQQVEVQAKQVDVHGFVEDPETYPVSPKRHTMAHLREHAHLRPRTNIVGAISRLRNTTSFAIHRFFQQHEFMWVNTPIITASDCEGAGELFRVSTLDLMNLPKKPDGQIDFSQDFFTREAFLTVSGQLNAECYAQAMTKVYTFGPTFRAENSHTARHLAEFWMVEPEMAFADLEADAKLAENMLKFVVKTVLDERQDDIDFFTQWVDKTCRERLEKIADSKFVHIEYTEAIKILENASQQFEYPVKWGLDLQSEHERYLCEEKVGAPVIVKNYPKDIKAFYMRLNDDNKTVAAMDVLAPGVGEIIGGAQREERLEVLDRRILEAGMQIEDYSWYRDLRRYGTVAHAGFGLGFERLVAYLSGVANIRDIHPFPRTPGHATF